MKCFCAHFIWHMYLQFATGMFCRRITTLDISFSDRVDVAISNWMAELCVRMGLSYLIGLLRFTSALFKPRGRKKSISIFQK